MNLVIVESPTKAKTIAKFLGSDYKIVSSFGHIRDLPKSKMGIDIENGFEPEYVIPAKAKQTVSNLKKDARKADTIVLASDEDREGEAIAWHIIQALGLKNSKSKTANPEHSPKVKRIVFHEITKNAILEALEHPRDIDMKLVDAQQARRVLDRLVGYELSPFLWKKVARGLSAGRVQSVAVRLIVEREREINEFKIEEYWSVEAFLRARTESGETAEFTARLNKISGKTIGKLEIKNKEAADKILAELKGARRFVVVGAEEKESKKSAPKPFTTSTLQQAANRLLGFSAKQTMMAAQKLYEEGLITYMRTDSLNLSNDFLEKAGDYLRANFGEKYALKTPRKFKTKSKGAQEAHEAIRPTDAARSPETVAAGDRGRQRLYELIWRRALASQMPDAVVSGAAIDIEAEETPYQFRATGQVLKFDGYLKVYPEQRKETELPAVKKGEELDLKEMKAERHFTKPPARYSDAGLVKVLEKYGIGRPSTYAPTISTIIARNYARRDENKKLAPTEIAFVVNDLLVEHFPQIVDYEFTAKMESDLDDIASGKKQWRPVVGEFYFPFHKNLEEKYNQLNKKDIMPEEKSSEKCDKCGADMVIKTGRYGKFLACGAYPDCKNIKPLANAGANANAGDDEKLEELKEKYKNEKCDKCGEAMVVRNGKFGPFLGCSGYPKCKTIKNIGEGGGGTGVKCPNCGKGEIVQKRSRRGIFYACDQYPDCKNAYWGKPTGEKCPECGALLIHAKNDSVKCGAKECGYSQ